MRLHPHATAPALRARQLSRLATALVPSRSYILVNTTFALLFFFGVMYLVMYFVTVADSRKAQDRVPEVEWPKITFIALGTLAALVAMGVTLPHSGPIK